MLIAVFFIDLEHFIIPDSLNIGLAITGLAYAVLFAIRGEYPDIQSLIPLPITEAFQGAALGVLTLWSIALLGRILFKKDAMGHGDIKLARALGMMLLSLGLFLSLAVAIFLGALVGVILIITSKSKATNISETKKEDPEPIIDLIKSGLYYLLFIDVIIYFLPNTESLEEELLHHEEDQTINSSPEMIPFGPFLVFGAMMYLYFGDNLETWLNLYLDWAFSK